MTRLRALWEALRSSLWFVPTLLVVVAVVAAITLIEIDTHIDESHLQHHWPYLFGAGADGSRGMLATIASSMITVAGVAFSITIVALVLASNQYTSRILLNFMRDRANQVVLGAFVSIYVYCLVVLRTIRGGDEGAFVPSFAVLFAMVLAFGGIFCLIYFIHHIASSIQAEQILRSVTTESLSAIDRLFPKKLDEPLDESLRSADLPADGPWQPVMTRATGYLQGIEYNSLVEYARQHDVVLRMERGIGEFTVEDTPLLSVRGDPQDEHVATTLTGYYTIGYQRTMVQDLGFGIRQIVDVALKALSPGINDTTTAVTSVHYLTAILTRLATRRVTTSYGIKEGQLRVLFRGPTFAGFLGYAFDQIRQNAAGNVAVLRAMIQGLEAIAGATGDPQRRELVKRQADLVAALARQSIPEPRDCEQIEEDLARLQQLFTDDPPPFSARSS